MNENRPGAGHFSTFELELSLLEGERASNRQQIAEHLSGCSECRDAMAELKRLHAEFETVVLPRKLPVPAVAPRRSPWYLRPVVWAPALASAAAVILALGLRSGDVVPTQDAGDIQTKGGTQLLVFARSDGRTRQLVSGQSGARPGDQVRFVLTATSEHSRYLLLASVEASGKTNVYWPAQGQRSGAIGGAGRFEVPGSVVLDAAPGPERVFALLSSAPLDFTDVQPALEALARQGADAIASAKTLELSTRQEILTEQSTALLKSGSAPSFPE